MINKRAKHYGAYKEHNFATTAFYTDFIKKLDSSWIDDFYLDTFQLKTEKQATGLNFDSIKVLEMMASVNKND
jgi:hypothetical protein